ncbi:MAG: hypothetical protein ACE5EK_11575 [Nitrospinales bacterium]
MDYKTLFIIDPVRGERIHLAKFIKQDSFTLMTFLSLPDCFKAIGRMPCDMIIYVLRKNKTELNKMFNIKDKHKKIHFLLYVTPDYPEVSLTQLNEKGFKSVFKTNNHEKTREITLELLAPDGIQKRPETPHPVPLTG